MGTRWRLVGRDAELAAVEAAFTSPGVDAAAGVVVAGDAGVGRTRLAREVEHRLRRNESCRVEWVSALVAPASVAFGAMAHLLPDDIAPEGQPAAVIAAVAQRLAARDSRRRLVLVVDDAHRMDGCSATLVAHLVAHLVLHHRAFVVATVLRGHPVPGSLDTLWKDGLVRRVDVGFLPPQHMDRLLDAGLAGLAGPGPVDGITRRRLLRVADGRPATLRGLLRSKRRVRRPAPEVRRLVLGRAGHRFLHGGGSDHHRDRGMPSRGACRPRGRRLR